MNTTEIADRYRRLATGFSERVAAVPADSWDAQSPCSEWTAREVLRHVVDGQLEFPSKVGIELPKGPSVDDDPVAAWEYTRTTIQAILDDPAKSEIEYDGGMGKSTLGASIGSFFCVDLVVHGWDIARATGGDETIPPDDIAFVSNFIEGIADMMRGPGAFGPEVETTADADDQTKLLAYLGRSV
ncbi:TIGR03086 family metal-binding protein [Antrihabitans cavernicola]|uniref:TIGR03086 family protein n=1 Tax=Antrihabitans cavernicola TaxID=2495913 RepID=A0A5A7SIX0_9NOCA|nr:TIGR03086 family metal-binding protein [Spelaeibacter cavernicola]KAA0024543.1 TIGR03086 family protein [Spelaeibacter cavernicola]